MAGKEAEEKKRETIKDHEERLGEINDSLRRKNLCITGVPESDERTEGQKAYLNKS